MPKGYEEIRDKLKKHMSLKAAKRAAAKIWNKTHKGTGQTVGRGRK
jgi:hypothetical protein